MSKKLARNEMRLIPQKPQPEIIDRTLFDAISSGGIFSPEECAELVEAYHDKVQPAQVASGYASDKPVDRNDWRKSKNTFIKPEDPANTWLFDRLLGTLMAANEIFKVEIDHFSAVQFATYDTGDYYHEHVDIGPGAMGNRKLSMTVQLTAPERYKGGDLLVKMNGEWLPMSREIGSVTVFPSFVPHKVSTVEEGTRHSLVVWAAGTHRFR